MSTLMESAMEARAAMRPRPVTRQSTPHLRCGICDEPIDPDVVTVYVDDERCHADCGLVDGSPNIELRAIAIIASCVGCGGELGKHVDESHCPQCGEPLR